MNEVSTRAPGGLAALRKNLLGVRARMPARSSDPFLRLLKDGNWVFGAEDHPLKSGTAVVVNVLSVQHGFTCWSNSDNPSVKNENLGEVMLPLSQTPPARDQLPQHGFPWKDQLSVDVKVLDGTYKNTQILYKASSDGAMTTLGGLLDAMLDRLDQDTDFVCPIVELGVDFYKHKKWGKTYMPIFDIVGWMDMEGNEEDAGEEQQDEVEAAVKRQIEKEPDPAPTRRAREPAVDETRALTRAEIAAAKAAAEVKEPAAPTEPSQGEPVRRRRRAE
jgi:hypothetical protein